MGSSTPTALRAANFLAPRLEPIYADLLETLAGELGVRGELVEPDDVDALARGELDLAFLCGLPYVTLRDDGADVEALAAPVFAAARYAHTPVYFSDLVVRADDRASELADLAGRPVAYNEVGSHSGYNALAAELAARGLGDPFLGRPRRSGGHDASLRLVLAGEADVAAIDSQVLEVAFEQEPELARGLKVIEAVGPSPAPPLVAGSSLEPGLRERLRQGMASTRSKSPAVEGWVAVRDATYDPIREMRARARSRVGL